jgi:hypothetical protein
LLRNFRLWCRLGGCGFGSGRLGSRLGNRLWNGFGGCEFGNRLGSRLGGCEFGSRLGGRGFGNGFGGRCLRRSRRLGRGLEDVLNGESRSHDGLLDL